MRWMRALQVCGLIAVAVACSGAPPSLDRIGEGYVRAALQLAQHDPDLVEAFRGSDSLIPGPRVPVASIAADSARCGSGIDQHANDIGSGIEKARIDYLDSQLRALDFAAGRLLGAIDQHRRAGA